jgi:hypothetical protein
MYRKSHCYLATLFTCVALGTGTGTAHAAAPAQPDASAAGVKQQSSAPAQERRHFSGTTRRGNAGRRSDRERLHLGRLHLGRLHLG